LKNFKIIFLEKKPFFNGFFSFIFSLFLWFLTLQIFSRVFIFIFALFKHISVYDFFLSTIHGVKQDISISSYLTLIAFVLLMFSNYKKIKVFISLVYIIVIGLSMFVVVLTLLDIQLIEYWNRKVDLQMFFYLKFPKEVFNTMSGMFWLIAFTGILLLTLILRTFFLRLFQNNIEKSFVISAKTYLLTFALLFLGIRGGFGIMPVLISDASFSEKRELNMLSTNSCWNFFYQITEAGGLSEIEHFTNGKFDNPALNKSYLNAESNGNFTLNYWDRYPNVVLIVLEGFSAEMSAFFEGHDGDEMPYIDELAKNGYAFTQAYASGDRTDKGLLSILSAWPGQSWQNLINHPSKLDKLPSLANQFNTKGYDSKFFYGGDLSFANMEFYLKSCGFNDLYGMNQMKQPTESIGKWGIQDSMMLQFAAKQLIGNQNPYFASILTLSTHEPYDLAPKSCKTVKEKMAFCMRYTNRALKSFIYKMQSSPSFNNTLFVVTADHGKELSTENTALASRNFFHIPLLFYGRCLPKKMQGKVNRGVVSQSDIYQSLVDLVLQTTDKNAVFSRSIFRPEHPKNAISNLTGSTMYFDSLSFRCVQTDKMSILRKGQWNRADSLLLSIQSKIIVDFLK